MKNRTKKRKARSTVAQMLNWRRQVLLGKKKYYPKSLLGAVAGMVQVYGEKDMKKSADLKSHYGKRQMKYLKKVETEFAQ